MFRSSFRNYFINIYLEKIEDNIVTVTVRGGRKLENGLVLR